MYCYFEALKKYAQFYGRSRRREFWYFLLFNAAIALCLMLIDRKLGTFKEELHVGLLSGVFYLSTIVPSIAVTVRRLHDINCSGSLIFMVLIPVIGLLILFMLLSKNGQYSRNKYGSNYTEKEHKYFKHSKVINGGFNSEVQSPIIGY